jgi:hypothetical protein
VQTTVKCAVVRLRALMAQQSARLITDRPIETLSLLTISQAKQNKSGLLWFYPFSKRLFKKIKCEIYMTGITNDLVLSDNKVAT